MGYQIPKFTAAFDRLRKCIPDVSEMGVLNVKFYWHELKA